MPFKKISRRGFGATAAARITVLSSTLEGVEGQEASVKTGGLYNGRYWRKLTTDERYFYLVGYVNGGDWLSLKIFLEIGAASVPKETASKIIHVCSDNFPPNMTYGEFIDAITKLYDDEPTNSPLPILSIVDVVIMKSKGASRAQIDAKFEALRAYWNNPDK